MEVTIHNTKKAEIKRKSLKKSEVWKLKGETEKGNRFEVTLHANSPKPLDKIEEVGE